MKRLALSLGVFLLATSAWAQQLPPGHPATDDGADPGLPQGHPGMGTPPADPPGMFRAPPDETEEDKSLPAGTILVQMRNGDNQVIPDIEVTLGILKNSVAKGESREHLVRKTDSRGYARFDGLAHQSGVAYRVSNVSNGGTFAAMPFQLPDGNGMSVVLHVYPVTGDMSHEQFFESAGAMYLELKDDRLLIQQAVRIFNATRFAWVPQNTIIKLPEGFTALQSGQAMSDQGVDSVEGGAKLRGTFAPGEHEVVFSWQLPYSGGKEMSFDVAAPPRMGSMVVRAAAAQGMQLKVDGFPQAQTQPTEDGQRLLATAKRVGENEPPIPRVHVSLLEIPTRGPAAEVTTLLAVLALATGIYLGTRKRTAQTKEEQKSDRDRILDEIDELERARRIGDVGPKTYERVRRELVDDLARTFAREAGAAKAGPFRSKPQEEPEPPPPSKKAKKKSGSAKKSP